MSESYLLASLQRRFSYDVFTKKPRRLERRTSSLMSSYLSLISSCVSHCTWCRLSVHISRAYLRYIHRCYIHKRNGYIKYSTDSLSTVQTSIWSSTIPIWAINCQTMIVTYCTVHCFQIWIKILPSRNYCACGRVLGRGRFRFSGRG